MAKVVDAKTRESGGLAHLRRFLFDIDARQPGAARREYIYKESDWLESACAFAYFSMQAVDVGIGNGGDPDKFSALAARGGNANI
jgi:hypothetical protein